MATKSLERPKGKDNDHDEVYIAHLKGPSYDEDLKALCGKKLKGVKPPLNAELCVVCREMSVTAHLSLK